MPVVVSVDRVEDRRVDVAIKWQIDKSAQETHSGDFTPLEAPFAQKDPPQGVDLAR
jgi:hypothetical protein